MRWVKLVVSLLVIAVLVIGVVSAVNFVKNLLFSSAQMLSNAGTGVEQEPIPEAVWVAPSIAPDDRSWSDQAYDTIYGADESLTDEPAEEEEEMLEEIPVEFTPEELAGSAENNVLSDADGALEGAEGEEAENPDEIENLDEIE